MFQSKKLLVFVTLAMTTMTTMTACATILGIDEREYDPNLAGASCETYCASAMKNCTDSFALYASLNSCLGTCAALEMGKPGDTNVNTVECRLHSANLAGETGEKADYCVQAGPGGGGTCGTNCEGYCKIMQTLCPGQFATESDCLESCATVPDHGNYNIAVPLENSLQCRLYHLTSAAVDSTHCEHAAGILKCIEMPDAGAD